MCIRDRASIKQFIEFAVNIPEHEPQVGQLKSSNSFNSVSYTHLRAHETVLDIVCRLLLEKKTYQHHAERL